MFYICCVKTTIYWDAMGTGVSIACAIHCAVLPVIITSLPVFGLDIMQNPVFEYGMILLAFLVGIYVLTHGFRKHHRRFLPLVLFSTGILCLLAKEVWPSMHIWLLIPAVIAIASAHFFNYRFCRLNNAAHIENGTH